jgi:hypothetical protein
MDGINPGQTQGIYLEGLWNTTKHLSFILKSCKLKKLLSTDCLYIHSILTCHGNISVMFMSEKKNASHDKKRVACKYLMMESNLYSQQKKKACGLNHNGA